MSKEEDRHQGGTKLMWQVHSAVNKGKVVPVHAVEACGE